MSVTKDKERMGFFVKKNQKTFIRLVAAIIALSFARAWAAEITIGMAAAPSSADPHYHTLTPNNELAAHVFDTLVRADAHNQLRPDLADSWTLEGDRTWRLALRHNVVFHDGTPFTAADVVYTLCRVLHPSGPTGSFQQASRALDSVEVIDDHTLKLHMLAPTPGFLAELTRLFIISAHSAGATATSFNVASGCGDIPAPPAAAFDSLKMANGTGPYRLTRFVSGDRAVLEANPHPNGPPPHWSRVILRALPNAGARLAGLLAGELDLIENPSAQDIPTIRSHGGLDTLTIPSNRLMFLQLDVARDPSPLITGPNRLRDPRVREAISLAIDRHAIAARLLDNMAIPADRYAPPGLFAALTEAPARPYDPARARQLIAEAGATGMALTLSATSDRYIGDASVAQAIGQYLTRVGLKPKVDVMPANVFFPRRTHREFSLDLAGWGYSPEGSANFLRTWLAEPDPVHGIGGSNYGGYASAPFNTALHQALTEMDDTARIGALQAAERQALSDNADIPLYWEAAAWAFKDRYTYVGRPDQETHADDLSLKGQ